MPSLAPKLRPHVDRVTRLTEPDTRLLPSCHPSPLLVAAIRLTTCKGEVAARV